MKAYWIGFFCFLVSAPLQADEKPSFLFDIVADDSGYVMKIAMTFSPGIPLRQVVANFRDPDLVHELHSHSTLEKTHIDSSRFEKLLTVKTFGFKTRLLSHCVESDSQDPTQWSSRCELDLQKFDAENLMRSKIERVLCTQATSLAPVRCTLDIRGGIKDYYIISSAKLTVKAKAQALINWGRFWYFTEAGSISPRTSSDLFDQSDLARQIEVFLNDGLTAAKIKPFRLSAGNPIPDFKEKIISAPSSTLTRKLDELTTSEMTLNSNVRLFQNGDALAAMKSLVENSKKYLFVSMLSVICDDSTEDLLQSMEQKAKTGVDVRLTVNRQYSILSWSCLNRLKKSGIDVLKNSTHSSYLINDQDEVMIGSESFSRMFFKSNGHNGLDRDLMLGIQGPVATDVLKNFLSIWDRDRSSENRDILPGIREYNDKITHEIRSGARGQRNYQKWLASDSPRGLCRFADQKPDRSSTGISKLLEALIQNSKKRIFFSGVTIQNNPLLVPLHEAARRGVVVDFFGNGWIGGNGELTMFLDELIQEQKEKGNLRVAQLLDWLKIRDMDQQASKRLQSYKELLVSPRITVWQYSGFVHYKAWSFDHLGVWVGSANPTPASFENFDESGVLCIDSKLSENFAQQVSADLANSSPLQPETMMNLKK